MKKILNIAGWSALLAGVLVLLGFVEHDLKQQRCTGIQVDVDRSNGNYFVEEDDVEQLIRNQYEVDSMLLTDFNLLELEERLNKNPSVQNAEVYTTITGKLKVDIEQRSPIIRVFSETGSSYYIDQDGWLMPLSNKYTSRILVANGAIGASFDGYYKRNVAELTPSVDSIPELKKLHQLYVLAKSINENTFWKAQINQVYIDAQGEMEMIPRVGNHRIILGDVSGLKRKLAKLMVFYQKGLNRTGWNEYSVINLKIKNQVVCTKRT